MWQVSSKYNKLISSDDAINYEVLCLLYLFYSLLFNNR